MRKSRVLKRGVVRKLRGIDEKKKKRKWVWNKRPKFRILRKTENTRLKKKKKIAGMSGTYSAKRKREVKSTKKRPRGRQTFCGKKKKRLERRRLAHYQKGGQH